jgi:transposase-like protein
MLWFNFFVKDNTSVLRAMDDFCGQVIDVLMSTNRDLAATRRFFTTRCNTAPCQPK